MYLLGIETSCDETAAAIIEEDRILSNIILTQTVHSKFGGVVPEIASREHIRHIVPIVEAALAEAAVGFSDIGTIAVTRGPGLVGCLLVGVSYARNLGLSLGVPVIGVNHLEGHIAAAFTDPHLAFPLLCLIASGGHTILVVINGFRNYRILGRSRDDAAGEAFDKVAKLLGLGYPGGAKLDSLAEQGDPEKYRFPSVKLKKGQWDFSFSGIKTAVALKVKSLKEGGFAPADVAAGFRKAVVGMLISRLREGIAFTRCRRLAIAGGVAQNKLLRREVARLSEETGIGCYFPDMSLCGDNGAMIAMAGKLIIDNKIAFEKDFDAAPYLPLE
ncbi:MAG: tRNA (adenosine(37)-N6)-threonylcarbamoyltransferase complex transferase subunit TsaD [candidate division Zixibacteria bacterium CG_4_9_14_3_um_filter_46_8]|nr:MAG: tRNA (adenosine(37)-N6)-threonylcarbamoyltransferase complex transferase subunit TsaD [candidate division Zixibacteria bacterium CG_4_9_14_3_um_filter_46_8]